MTPGPSVVACLTVLLALAAPAAWRGRCVGGARRRAVALGVGADAPSRSIVPVAGLSRWLTRQGGTAAFDRNLPDALEALARSLRAGTSLRNALRESASTAPGPVGDDLIQLAAGLDHGQPAASVLFGWIERRPVAGVRLTVAALVLGAHLGGSRARAVDRVAAGLRDRAAIRREIGALSTQARLSAVVIAVAPVVFLLVGVVGDARLASFLFATRAGVGCLVGGLLLDAAAAWWMARIVREAGR